jgi:starch synthase
MKIVFAASEMVPFAKTGGLGDVTGTLPREVARLGNEVIAFVPRYKRIDPAKWGLKTEIDQLSVALGSEKEIGKIYSCKLEGGIQVYLVDHPEFFCREELYGTAAGDYPDNDRRFIFFQRAVLETLKALKIKADVIHCHDWQTGLIPVYLKTLYAEDTVFRKTKTVYSIHNLGFQGNFPPDSLSTTGLDWDQFRMERLEFYGKISFLKGGLLDADVISTVSERYAREIQTKEFGCGMENVLSQRKDKIFGILNGLDYKDWDPSTDPDIAEVYNAKTIEKKLRNKIALQKENDFNPDAKAPLIGIVSRLTEQKGIDILLSVIGPIFDLGAQVVVLGTGDEKYHRIFRELAKKKSGACKVHILFDAKMAKRIYAGCDLVLVPSYYEPCGLGQLIALRYGTIPVVRATGGLADSIQEFDPSTGMGTGFNFEDYSGEALLAAVGRALSVYKNERNWYHLVQNAMTADFSWTASAKKYLRLYEIAGQRSRKES